VDLATPHPWVDLARVVLVLLPGAADLGVAVVVLFHYFRAYQLTSGLISREAAKATWQGLLPRHVWAVTISYSALVAAALADTVLLLRDPLSWRPFVYAPAFAFGFLAMWDVLGHERRRLVTLRDAGSTPGPP